MIAAFAAGPALARRAPDTLRWTGRAFGAEVALNLSGPRDAIRRARDRALDELSRIEALFTLYDPHSFLRRLNATGRATIHDHRISDLLTETDRLWSATEGRFDPSVQSVWEARAPDAPIAPWSDVRWTPARIDLAPGQRLTFNGIAQGYATDRVAACLAAEGATQTLVNIGEFRATGGPYRLAIADPDWGEISRIGLADSAVATSSPGALRFADGSAHIIDPTHTRAPLWSSVTVEAARATTADAASTAFCLMTRAEILAARRQLPDIRRVWLIETSGDISTI